MVKNNIDPAIKFTVEGLKGNGAIPFLDTLVMPLPDGSLSITVYCKPIHTDQYLQWDSHHSLSATYSVIGTLTHRAKVVCIDPELLQGEINHLRITLKKCNYPTWAINRVQQQVLNNNWGILATTIQQTKTTLTTANLQPHKQGTNIPVKPIATTTIKTTINPKLDKATKLQWTSCHPLHKRNSQKYQTNMW